MSDNSKGKVSTLESRLSKVQAIAGGLFAVFVLLHLSNIFMATLGAVAFNDYQQFLRRFYQHPLIEILVVLGPLIAHMIAGAWLAIITGKRGKRPITQRLHSWAGTFLFVVIVGHVIAVRGPSYFFGVFPAFEGLSFSLWYFPAYFYPYYFLLALAGFFHSTNGLRMMAARQGYVVHAKVHRRLSALASLWIAVSLASLGGYYFDISDPTDNAFARLARDFTGINPETPIRIWHAY